MATMRELEQELDMARPIRPGMPPVPTADFYDPAQWAVLYSLLDAVLPALAPTSSSSSSSQARTDGALGAITLPDDEFEAVIDRAASAMGASRGDRSSRDALEAFFTQNVTAQPQAREDTLRVMAMSPKRAALGKILSLMNTYLGSRLLTGYWGPITTQPSHVRQDILHSWVTSRWPILRSLGKSMSTIALKSVVTSSSLWHQLSGYTDVPRDWKQTASYDFRFIEPGVDSEVDADADADIHIIETDVVIVGSGCGGAVCARNLAEAGHRVLVVDKGYNFPSSHLPMSQNEGTQHLFDNKGILMADDGGLAVIAASTWGGGGTVNWSVCLKLEDKVRAEWADRGLPFFASHEYDACLARVWERAGASADGIRHNHSNRMLLAGASRLGWATAEAPQNTGGQQHDCGQCHLGCGSAGKRGPTVSWLPAAAEAGAQFIEGFDVDRVLFDEEDDTKAVGVQGIWTSRGPGGRVDVPDTDRTTRKVRIQAKKVIIAAGTIRSPVILMASGIENPQLGQNLHLHPTNVVSAIYENDTDPVGGSIITSYCSEFSDLDGKAHGVKLETTCMVPFLCFTMVPWRGGIETKLLLLKYPRLSSFIVITRDRDTGAIRRDPVTGEPVIDYTVSEFDQKHAEEGVVAMAKLCYMSGAAEIHVYYAGLEPFVRTKKGKEGGQDAGAQEGESQSTDPEKTDPAFAEWLQTLRAKGNKPPTGQWSSAHQMGTCRMGSSPAEGVVDDRGKVWGKEGLYVADSSVFPSASGVNPMITIQTIADWISRGVDADLRS